MYEIFLVIKAKYYRPSATYKNSYYQEGTDSFSPHVIQTVIRNKLYQLILKKEALNFLRMSFKNLFCS